MLRLALVTLATLLAAGGPARAQFGGLLGGGGGIATETTQLLNNAELIAQVANSARQLEAELRMLEGLAFNDTASVAGSLFRINSIARSVARILYRVEEVTAQYAELYPEAFPGPIDRPTTEANRADQERLSRDAGLASKRTSAATMEQLQALSERISALLSASQAAAGQTAAIQAGNQAAILVAELNAHAIALQAAHYRAVEAQQDAATAAAARAEAHTRHMWRGIGTYGE